MNTKNVIKKHTPYLYNLASDLKFIVYFYKYFKALNKLYRAVSPHGTLKKRIVFNLVRPYAYPILFFESVLAMKLSELGAQVNVLVDDGILLHHDTLGYDDIDISVKMKIKVSVFFLEKLSLYKKYSEFVAKNDLDDVSEIASFMIAKNNYLYKNIDLKPYIDASVIRFFRSAVGIVQEEPEYNKILKVCTQNAIISTLVASKVENLLNPDIIVTSHGIYSTWGPFYDYFKQKRKRVITYGFSCYRNNGIIFSKNGLVANRCDDGFFNAYKNKIDINLAEKEIKDFFDKRFKGKSADLTLFGSSNEDRNLIEKIKKIGRNKKIFALFPNVLWDNSLIGADTIFDSQVEWIIETIKFFKKQKDKLLIIRAHPAEASWMKVRVGVKDIIEREFGRSIQNIGNLIFIPSSYPLKSYLLFPLLTAGIVYNGTIGLEMMYKRIPVLIAGKAPYSGKGFTIDFTNEEEYFRAFDKVEGILKYQEKNREVLIKFLFYYFVLNEIPLSFYNEHKWCTPKINANHELIFTDKNLEHIAKTILEQRSFFQEWRFYNEK